MILFIDPDQEVLLIVVPECQEKNSSSKLYLYIVVKTPGHISESVSVTFNIRTIKKAYVREKNDILKKGNGVKVCKG